MSIERKTFYYSSFFQCREDGAENKRRLRYGIHKKFGLTIFSTGFK